MNDTGAGVSAGKAVRAGSALKRAAILDTARDLFVRNGIDRVSMDTVAAQASVSKRTVYDYFGDKQHLFQAILADTSHSLSEAIRRTLDQHLPLGPRIATSTQLEAGLTALAIELGTTVVGSADYAAGFALVAQQRLRTPTTDDDIATAEAERALEERLGHFAAAGLLDIDDPSVAALQFFALTVLLAYERQPVPARADHDRIRHIMTTGARTFMRAYAPR